MMIKGIWALFPPRIYISVNQEAMAGWFHVGLGDVYQIVIGRCLQWNIVMDDDIVGWG